MLITLKKILVAKIVRVQTNKQASKQTNKQTKNNVMKLLPKTFFRTNSKWDLSNRPLKRGELHLCLLFSSLKIDINFIDKMK